MNKNMVVKTSFGSIIAEELTDPEHKGVAVCFQANNGDLIDLALVEVQDNNIALYLYEDAWDEDYTTKSLVSVDALRQVTGDLKEFYFTYGDSETHPFCGGWTKVCADSRSEAIKKFQEKHPSKMENILNCAFVYSEEEFLSTDMMLTGNRGAFCHEVIR